MFKSIPFISHVIMHLVHLLCLCSILQIRQMNFRHEFRPSVFPPPTILLLNIQLLLLLLITQLSQQFKGKETLQIMTSPANGDYNTRPISPTSQTRQEQKPNTKKRKNNARLLKYCLLIFHKMLQRSFRRFGHFVMQQILRQGRPAPAPSLTLEPGPHSGPAKL